MKKLTKKLMTTFLATIIFTALAFAQNSKDEQELIKLDKDWSAAIERSDRDALNRIIADDYTDRGGTANKAQYTERIFKEAADNAVNLKNFTSVPSNYSVKFKGDGTAVMTHTIIEKGEYKGTPFTDYRTSLHVWMRRNGRWQVVASEGAPFTDEQVLRQMEREWGDAAKNRDRAWFERAFANEFISITSRGKVHNKAEEIADALSDAYTITSDELSDLMVWVQGDAAMVVGRLHIVGKDKNGNFDRNYRFTDTFIKRDGRWQVLSSQSTLVTPETTAKN